MIQILNADQVRLILPAEEPSGPYVAFSHCWGGVQAVKLLRGDIGRFRTGLRVKELPESYQEAISICIRMNLHFIWIDSLCIIQDSHEDWKREALTMKLVYGNSLLNLCAAAGSNSGERSTSSRQPDLVKPFEITSSWANQDPQSVFVIFGDLFYDDVLQSPLHTRAWVYQEYYLSKRSLVLGRSQLWWHCREKLACEGCSNGLPDELLTSTDSAWSLAATLKDDLHRVKVISRFRSAEAWQDRVQKYTQMFLTKETDRIIAFSGIVEAFGESHNVADQYLAGLWRCYLPYGLRWIVGRDAIMRRGSVYRTPSWSWISLGGHFAMGGGVSETLLSSLERIWPHYDEQDKGIMALSKGGAIEVRGHLMGPRKVGGQGEPSYFEASFLFSQYLRRNMQSTPQPRSRVSWDEHEALGEPLVSYLDGLNLASRGKALIDGAHREQMRLRDAPGSFFYLPLETDGETGFLEGIVLYQPPHQPGIFHRVGEWSARECIDGSPAGDLATKYPEQTVYII